MVIKKALTQEVETYITDTNLGTLSKISATCLIPLSLRILSVRLQHKNKPLERTVCHILNMHPECLSVAEVLCFSQRIYLVTPQAVHSFEMTTVAARTHLKHVIAVAVKFSQINKQIDNILDFIDVWTVLQSRS